MNLAVLFQDLTPKPGQCLDLDCWRVCGVCCVMFSITFLLYFLLAVPSVFFGKFGCLVVIMTKNYVILVFFGIYCD